MARTDGSHAAQRAAERHGVELTRADLKAIVIAIWAGRAERLVGYPAIGDAEAWLIPRRSGPPLPVLYSRRLDRVLTVLHRDFTALATLADVIPDGVR